MRALAAFILSIHSDTITIHRLLRFGGSMLASLRPPIPKDWQTRHVVHAAGAGRAAVCAVSRSRSTSTTATADAGLLKAAGWRLALLEATQNQRVDKELRSEFSWALRLKGVTFDNMEGHPTQALVQQLQPGQGLMFCKDSSNPADPHAVAVFTAGMQHLGYVPADAAKLWRLQTCFGRVMSVGVAGDSGNWGAAVQVNPLLQGIVLDLLPDSWAQAADMEQVLGPKAWSQVQVQVREQHQQRCAISSMPAQEQQQPLHVMPQWGFDPRHKRVQLAGLIPVCQPLVELKQQLAAAAEQLGHLSPDLQLSYDVPESAAAVTPLDHQQQQHEVAPLHAEAAALHAAQAAVAAEAVAALPAEQQACVNWIGFYNQYSKHTPWPQLDCVRYLAYAGWRRQQLLLQDGWQLVQPDAQQVAALLSSAAGPTAAGTSGATAQTAAAALKGPAVRRALRPGQAGAQQQHARTS